jgi:hypothetical protein
MLTTGFFTSGVNASEIVIVGLTAVGTRGINPIGNKRTNPCSDFMAYGVLKIQRHGCNKQVYGILILFKFILN